MIMLIIANKNNNDNPSAAGGTTTQPWLWTTRSSCWAGKVVAAAWIVARSWKVRLLNFDLESYLIILYLKTNIKNKLKSGGKTFSLKNNAIAACAIQYQDGFVITGGSIPAHGKVDRWKTSTESWKNIKDILILVFLLLVPILGV